MTPNCCTCKKPLNLPIPWQPGWTTCPHCGQGQFAAAPPPDAVVAEPTIARAEPTTGSELKRALFVGGALAGAILVLATGIAVMVMLAHSSADADTPPVGPLVLNEAKKKPLESTNPPVEPPKPAPDNKPVPKEPPAAKKSLSAPKESNAKSNLLIPLDNFGNPHGENVGLAHRMEFAGKKLIAWWNPRQQGNYILRKDNPLWQELREKGFEVRVETHAFQTSWLKEADQFWLFSGIDVGFENSTPSDMNDAAYAAVEDYVRQGKGLYLLADDAPHCIAEANLLAQRLFDTKLSGNYQGTRNGYLKNRSLSKEQIQKFKGTFAVDDHKLFTGVNLIFEGISISHFNPTPKLEVVLNASDGNPVIGISRVPGLRVVLDCGYTKYYYDPGDSRMSFITQTAGTKMFATNVAAYLAGK